MLAKGAYIISFENAEGKNDWIIPVKHHDPLQLNEKEFLTDFLEVEDYIKKNMAHIKSNLVVSKVKEVVNVSVNRLSETKS